MEKIRMLIVDDYPVVREGLRTMLSTDQSIEIAGEAADGAEAVAMVAEKKPNVVLMGIRLPNIDGLEATRHIKGKYPSVAVIIFTMDNNNGYVIDAIRAGASGFLSKDASRELLLHTVRMVSSGVTLIKSDLLYKAICSLVTSKQGQQKMELSTTEGLEALTPREQAVLRLVVEGHTNRDIGKELSIAEDTVKKHMQNIIAKLGASNRIDAAIKAVRTGIIK